MQPSLARIPFSYAKRHQVFVQQADEEQVTISYVEPLKPTVMLELQRQFPQKIAYQAVEAEHFPELLAKAYESGAEQARDAISGIEENMDLTQLMQDMPNVEDLLESEDDAPVIRLINAVLTQAIKQLASDVHFETFEDKFVVRFRIDGVLQEILQPPRVMASLLISRLKIMSKLDIAEKRLPQDGRIALKIAGRNVDVRVSSIPTYYGERVVLRLLDKQSAPLDLNRLGMLPKTTQYMRELIETPNGIVLVTGPTGSGKSTTLYAALTELNTIERNILTVEDPIEYYLNGVGQTQVNSKIGMTFARGLRAILRQDPDIVMVGEIRDLETAEMAVQASLTGHLVLSTLHTNSAIGAVTRLRDMGVEPFLISSTLIGVVAQRLVRLLCPHCKSARKATEAERKVMGIPESAPAPTVYEPQGCEHCHHYGYLGRSGIYELIKVDDTLQEMIHDNQSEHALERHARKFYPSMRQDGWQRVLNGDTTVSEIIRVTSQA